MLFWGAVFNGPAGFHFLEVKKCNSPECTMLRDASQVKESQRQTNRETKREEGREDRKRVGANVRRRTHF